MRVLLSHVSAQKRTPLCRKFSIIMLQIISLWMSVNLFPDTLMNGFMDNVVTEAKKEVMHRFNNKINSGYHHQSVHQSFEYCIIFWGPDCYLVATDFTGTFFMKRQKFVLTGIDTYSLYGFVFLVHHVSHNPTRHRIIKCFVYNRGISHNIVSLFYNKRSKAVSNVREGLLVFPCTTLPIGAGLTEWWSDLLNYHLLEIIPWETR